MAEAKKFVHNDIDKIDLEEDFATMFEESLKSEEATVCDGVIVNIKDDEVYVDVRKKSEGVMSISEITDENGNLLFNQRSDIIIKSALLKNDAGIIGASML